MKIGIVAVLVLAMIVCVGAASAFTVTFNAGYEGGGSDTQTVEAGVWTTLKPVSFTAPDTQKFIGWSGNDNKYYTDQQAVKPTNDLTLTAQWSNVIEWTTEAQFTNNTISEKGYYLLNVDELELVKGITVTGAPVVIDLNGKVLSRKSGETSGFSIITVDSNGVLTLIDTSESNNDHCFTYVKNGVWALYTGETPTDGENIKVYDTLDAFKRTEADSFIGGIGSTKEVYIEVAGGVITGGIGGELEGGGVSVKEGTFTMNGGIIVGNEANGSANSKGCGGGVIVYNGTFTMNRGNIVGNEAGVNGGGGGVMITGPDETTSKFIMTGGYIVGNTAMQRGGGGVDAWSGEFEMTGGTIAGNKATQNGGGVFVNDACVSNLSGNAIIKGNEATQDGGGVYVVSGSRPFMVSGSPVIKDNKKVNGTTEINNVWIIDSMVLQLVGKFTGDIRITSVGGKRVNEVVKGDVINFGTVEYAIGDDKEWEAAHFRSDDGECCGIVDSGNMLQWRKATVYIITYRDKGDVAFSGKHGSDYPTIHKSGTPTPLERATKDGYTFGGWFNNIECTGDAITELGANEYTADITLYAKWTANKYTVTLNPQGGIGGTDSVTATYGEAMQTLSSLPTRDGYTFAGYFDAATGGNKYYNADGTSAKNWDKTEHTTLYAHWTAIEPPQPQTSSSGSSVTTFRGSATVASDGTIVFDRSTVVTEVIVTGASGAKVTPTSNKDENGWYGFDLTVSDAPNGGEIYYQVPLDVIAIKGYTEHDVCLYHKENGAWTALPTYLVTKDARYAYYKSVTESFSPFYIGFEEGAAKTEVIEPVVVEDPTPIEEPVEPILPQPAATPFPVLGLLAGLGAAAVFLKRRQ
ncbi:MAG TPA: InlB B-repeat-containing protein [Methanocorpusculum sp.]|nr:InlB B-repeat-containing protein [Methanocorpusculum sp.]